VAIEGTQENLEQILTAGVPVVVDFWASWCGPCKYMDPILEDLEKDNVEVTFVKVNVDEQKELASEYNIRSIPTFIFYDGLEVVSDRVSGAIAKAVFQKKLKAIS